MRQLIILIPLVALLCGCGGAAKDADVREFTSRSVTLPDGSRISAEVMTSKMDMNRGMMFRDSLPEGRGMLFIHGSPERYQYWMYNVRMPLDIIWMDARGLVVEVVENAQPCSGPPQQCPNYGGKVPSLVVLELPGGYARKRGVVEGASIRF